MFVPSAVLELLGASHGFVTDQIFKVSGGFSKSDVFCLEDSLKNKIVLKSTPIDQASLEKGVAKIEAVFQLQEFLTNSNLPWIARPIQIGPKGVYTDRAKSRVWLASSWIDGQELPENELNSNAIHQASSIIGQIIKAMRRFDDLTNIGTNRRFDGFDLRARELERFRKCRFESRELDLLTRKLESECQADLNSLFSLNESQIANLQHRLALVRSDPAINNYQWCLRDIQIGNCLFNSQGSIVGIIDFDAFGLCQPIFDIVRFVSSVIVPNDANYVSTLKTVCADFGTENIEEWQVRTLDLIAAICGAFFWLQQLSSRGLPSRSQRERIINRLERLLLRIQLSPAMAFNSLG